MSNLSSMMISLLILGLFVSGPIIYYTVLMSNAEDKYGVTMTMSRDTQVFNVTDQVLNMAEQLKSNTTSIASGNVFTDFVGLLVAGVNTLRIMFNMTGIFTNVTDEFLNILGINNVIITATIMGIILIIITAKILSIALNRDV